MSHASRIRRWSLSACKYLVAGCVLTVLVSWTIAVFAPPRKEGLFDHNPGPWPVMPPSDWTASPGSHMGGPRGRFSRWELYQTSKQTIGLSESKYELATLCEMELVFSGFPQYALATARFRESDTGINVPPKSVRDVWQVQVPILRGRIASMPLRPIWPGFALNTIFYAVIAWGLWQIPSAIRRRSRRRAGRCVGCGYDRTGLGQDAMCPECGAGAGPVRGKEKAPA